MSETQSTYDPVAETFARSRKKPWPDIVELVEQVKLSVMPSRFEKLLGNVLDVGCWSGRLLDYLPSYQTYMGIDESEGLLKVARSERAWGIFAKMDMRDIDKLEPVFDTVFFVASFHHITDTQEQVEVLQKTIALLSSGGVICLLNWNLRSHQNALKYSGERVSDSVFRIPIAGQPRMYYAFSTSEIEKLFQNIGGCVKVYNEESGTRGNILSIFRKS